MDPFFNVVMEWLLWKRLEDYWEKGNRWKKESH
jgi:hypothetical protein